MTARLDFRKTMGFNQANTDQKNPIVLFSCSKTMELIIDRVKLPVEAKGCAIFQPDTNENRKQS